MAAPNSTEMRCATPVGKASLPIREEAELSGGIRVGDAGIERGGSGRSGLAACTQTYRSGQSPEGAPGAISRGSLYAFAV